LLDMPGAINFDAEKENADDEQAIAARTTL
jgi:hypothetical protein